MDFDSHSLSHSGGSNAGTSRETRGFYGRYGKRVLDLGIALMILPSVALVFAAIWVLIRWSGGKAIYSQDRVGQGGKLFKCYKFRTMVPNAEQILAELCANDPAIAAEWSEFQKLRHDPRITRVGSILRKTSLDELPQIINVIRGDMSLVGPRPFMPDQEQLYRDAGGREYYKLRPGITGEWQVTGRGETSFIARVLYDNHYGSRLTFANDLRLLAKTFHVVLACKGH